MCETLVSWSKNLPDFHSTHLPSISKMHGTNRGPHWLGTAVSMAGGFEVFQKGRSLGPLTHSGQPLGIERIWLGEELKDFLRRKMFG